MLAEIINLHLSIVYSSIVSKSFKVLTNPLKFKFHQLTSGLDYQIRKRCGQVPVLLYS